jgi:hypothetical protein
MMRQGMLLSSLSEQMLGQFRSIFYRKAGMDEDQDLIIHPLGKVVTYGRRGWTFSQRLGDGYRMVFQHYGVKADKSEYGKYDHVVYVDIETDKVRTTQEERLKAYEAKKSIASEATKEIGDFLVANGLAVGIEFEDPAPPKQRLAASDASPQKAGT